jgi:hypothetical protein
MATAARAARRAAWCGPGLLTVAGARALLVLLVGSMLLGLPVDPARASGPTPTSTPRSPTPSAASATPQPSPSATPSPSARPTAGPGAGLRGVLVPQPGEPPVSPPSGPPATTESTQASFSPTARPAPANAVSPTIPPTVPPVASPLVPAALESNPPLVPPVPGAVQLRVVTAQPFGVCGPALDGPCQARLTVQVSAQAAADGGVWAWRLMARAPTGLVGGARGIGADRMRAFAPSGPHQLGARLEVARGRLASGASTEVTLTYELDVDHHVAPGQYEGAISLELETRPTRPR